MDVKKFLSAVLSDKGFYCAVGIKNGKTIQRFYQTVDNLVEAAGNFDHDGYDAYFALATFGDNNSRKADNVSHLKSLFLDLDCGEGKPYATQHEAIKALQEFCRALRIPKPSVIVNSGRGVHVYWVLDRGYARDEWVPAAERLKAACSQSGLHADPAVTLDAARILRIPGTHNYKGTPPIDVAIFRGTESVYKLHEFVELLPEHLATVTATR